MFELEFQTWLRSFSKTVDSINIQDYSYMIVSSNAILLDGSLILPTEANAILPSDYTGVYKIDHNYSLVEQLRGVRHNPLNGSCLIPPMKSINPTSLNVSSLSGEVILLANRYHRSLTRLLDTKEREIR